MAKDRKKTMPAPAATTEKRVEQSEIRDVVSINEFIERLPMDMRGEASAIFMAMEQKSYHGPIPSPEDLRGYEEVLPNAADRIITMAEKNSTHRIEMEKNIIEGNLNLSKRGQLMGFFLAILFVGVAVFLTIRGHEKIGITLITTTLLGVLAVFVLNERPWESKKE